MKCINGHPWCNRCVAPLTEEDFLRAADFLFDVDQAFEREGPIAALEVAKQIIDNEVKK